MEFVATVEINVVEGGSVGRNWLWFYLYGNISD
jgi:hypothetical protein